MEAGVLVVAAVLVAEHRTLPVDVRIADSFRNLVAVVVDSLAEDALEGRVSGSSYINREHVAHPV